MIARILEAFVIVSTVFGLIVFLKSKRSQNAPTDDFWERESKANSVRRKPLDHLDYVTIPLNALPIQKNTTDEQLLEYQEIITSLANQKIVNLNGISNTDLKLTYGAPNLPTLTEYDQNFILLARTLNTWAHRLYELGMISEARTVLEFGISCRTDIKAHYVLLAKIYQLDFHPERIDSLIETAGTLHSIMKQPIIDALTELRNPS